MEKIEKNEKKLKKNKKNGRSDCRFCQITSLVPNMCLTLRKESLYAMSFHCCPRDCLRAIRPLAAKDDQTLPPPSPYKPPPCCLLLLSRQSLIPSMCLLSVCQELGECGTFSARSYITQPRTC